MWFPWTSAGLSTLFQLFSFKKFILFIENIVNLNIFDNIFQSHKYFKIFSSSLLIWHYVLSQKETKNQSNKMSQTKKTEQNHTPPKREVHQKNLWSPLSICQLFLNMNPVLECLIYSVSLYWRKLVFSLSGGKNNISVLNLYLSG